MRNLWQSGNGAIFFVRVLRFAPVSIIPPVLHTHLHLHVAVSRRTNGRSLDTFQKAMPFQKAGSIGWKCTFTFLTKDFLRVLLSSPVCIISPLLHTPSAYGFYEKDKRAKPGDLRKNKKKAMVFQQSGSVG